MPRQQIAGDSEKPRPWRRDIGQPCRLPGDLQERLLQKIVRRAIGATPRQVPEHLTAMLLIKFANFGHLREIAFVLPVKCRRRAEKFTSKKISSFIRASKGKARNCGNERRFSFTSRAFCIP